MSFSCILAWFIALDPDPPDPPSSLTAVVTSTSQITITWAPNGPVRYQYRNLTSTGSGFTNKMEASGTSVDVTELSAGHNYEFQVFAVENGVESTTAATATQATSKCHVMAVHSLLCLSGYHIHVYK